MNEIRLVVKPGSFGSQVWVNGQEITGLRAVEVRAAVDEPSRVTLTFVAARVDIEGAVDDVTGLDSEAREFVKR